MAQTGYTPIQLYNSSTASAAPTAGNLATGELAINTLDEKLYFKNSAGVVKVLASTAATGSVTSVAATVPSFLSVSGSPITSSGTLAFSYSGTALPVANGGTGLTSLTANYIPYGAGTSAFASSANLQFDGTVLRVGSNAVLGGTTNPVIASTGSTNNYIQSYIYNATNGASSSADFVAYANNSTDAHGWSDLGFTSASYADATYTVTGPNEAYLFGSAPTGAGTSGNLVYATDNTGTTNAHQWYVGGFTQAKSAWKMQLNSAGLQLANALPVASGGTGLTAPGASGNVLTSNGTSWVSSAPTSGGTVTSVAVSGGTTGLTTSGGPVTTTGTITLAGTLAVANGGTGLTTTPANGALDIGNGTGFTRTTLTAGSGVTITNSAGSITIATSGGSSLTGVTQSGSPYLTTLGYQAAPSATGIFNAVMGWNSAPSLSSGNRNTVIGSSSAGALTTGTYNTVVGAQNVSLLSNGGFNTAISTGALDALVSGTDNVAVGYRSLVACTGSTNTALGNAAGGTITSGGNNTTLGYQADVSSATISNTITLGNSSIATLRCQVTSITALSDARDKTDVAPLPYGLSFINNLNPVSFTWNTRDGGKVGVKSSGFIAQELKATQEAFNASETLNLVFDDNPEKLEATYGHLLPVMVKAIQELSAKVEQLEKQLKLA